MSALKFLLKWIATLAMCVVVVAAVFFAIAQIQRAQERESRINRGIILPGD